MDITTIKLSDGRPKSVTVKMSVDEAIFIGKFVGRLSPDNAREIWPSDQAAKVFTEVHSCLSGMFFNKFWDDGIDGAARGDSE